MMRGGLRAAHPEARCRASLASHAAAAPSSQSKGHMTQYRVDVDVRDLADARSLSGALQELLEPVPVAVSVFEAGVAGHKVSAYFADAPDPAGLVAGLGAWLGPDLAASIGRQMTITRVPDENWVAISQAALPPVTAGRFTIHGSHDRHRVPRGPNAIEIDAGHAFGTAHHATTLGCLMAIGELTRRRSFERVLDLGCGSGVLAIAAARVLPHARVLASDIDPQATAVARANVRNNRIAAGRLAITTADAMAHRAFRGRHFDLIIANILANPLIAIAKGLARHSPRGGTIVLSGLLDGQAAEVIAAYRTSGFALRQHRRIAGWSTLVLVRR